MTLLAFELVYRILWGSCVVLTLVDRKESSERFPRIAAHIMAGMAAFALVLHLNSSQAGQDMRPYLSLGLLLGGVYSYAFSQKRLLRIGGFVLYTLSPFFFLQNRDLSAIVNFFTSALLLGSVFGAQYLGHWYLTVPGMHIREFQRIVKLLVASLIFKIGENFYTLVMLPAANSNAALVDEMGRPLSIFKSGTNHFDQLEGGTNLLGIIGDGIFGLGLYGQLLLLTRLLWGILAPIILVWMIKRTVDMRSTQSATGILYALTVVVLVGELTALYLNNVLGWSL